VFKCQVNGQEVEVSADVPILPEVKDPSAPFPRLTLPEPQEVCRKYRLFLEHIDRFLRKHLPEIAGPLLRAEQKLPGRWYLYYSGLANKYVYVEIPVLSGLDEQGVGKGKGKLVLSPGTQVLHIYPEEEP